MQIGGGISQPFLSGTVVSTKPAKIDKVDLDSFRSKFDFSTAASLITLKDIQGKVKLGGDVTGGGTIALGKVPQINVNFQAKNLPGDVLAKVYDVNTSNVQIGTVSGNAQLSGGGSNVQTVVNFQAPRATYPTTGEIAIAPDKSVSFRNVVASVASGTVQASGSFANQRWQAVAQTRGIQLEPFVNKQERTDAINRVSPLQNVSFDHSRRSQHSKVSQVQEYLEITVHHQRHAHLIIWAMPPYPLLAIHRPNHRVTAD